MGQVVHCDDLNCRAFVRGDRADATPVQMLILYLNIWQIPTLGTNLVRGAFLFYPWGCEPHSGLC
jgi:hypothetical protein